MNKKPNFSDMRLWIVETNKGHKRTYETSDARAKIKMEKHGLIVKAVRPGTEKDNPENMGLL